MSHKVSQSNDVLLRGKIICEPRTFGNKGINFLISVPDYKRDGDKWVISCNNVFECSTYLEDKTGIEKDALVKVLGKLHQNRYTNRSGVEVSKVVVSVDEITVISRPESQSSIPVEDMIDEFGIDRNDSSLPF